ncbi:hypothetical protein WJX82_006634 [Trebouxia sp. C0006]
MAFSGRRRADPPGLQLGRSNQRCTGTSWVQNIDLRGTVGEHHAARVSYNTRTVHVSSEVTQHTTLVIDISDSMRGRPLQLLAESINDLILSFKKTDYVTIWTFNSDIYKLIAFRQAKNVRLDRLSRDLEKHCGQLTRLYDCISEAHTELCQHVEGSFKPRPHARFLVVFTDGEDNRSSKTASQVCTALENSPVPFLRTIFITAGLRTSSDVFKAVPAGGKIFRAETDQEGSSSDDYDYGGQYF